MTFPARFFFISFRRKDLKAWSRNVHEESFTQRTVYRNDLDRISNVDATLDDSRVIRITFHPLTLKQTAPFEKLKDHGVDNSFSVSRSKTSNQKLISPYCHNTVLWPHVFNLSKKTLPHQPSDIPISTKVTSSYAHNQQT